MTLIARSSQAFIHNQ